MKIKKCFILIFCMLLPFCLNSCMYELQPDGFTGEKQTITDINEDDDRTIVSMQNYLDAITVVTEGDGEKTYFEVETFINNFTETILRELFMEYGDSTIAKQRSSQDTHKNAMTQDNWKFASKTNYTGLNDESRFLEWKNEDIDKADYSLVLKYNIYQILLGKQVLDLEVANLINTSEYFVLKLQGEFSEDAFKQKAKQVTHTGLFYYEIDAISEYIIKYVIGENVISFDNQKFYDVNNNGTFDYNERFIDAITNIEYENRIIKSYTFDKPRATISQKSEIWQTIEFGDASESPILPESESNIVDEVAYSVQYITENNIGNKYTKDNLICYSGFKNYVNTVYYIVNSSVDYINKNYFVANANYQDYDASLFTLQYDRDNPDISSFNTDFDNYKALSFKFNESISVLSFWIYVEFEESLTEKVEMSIDATYYHCINPIKHEHSTDCVFEKVNANLGTITVDPSKTEEKIEGLYADLTLDEEAIERLKNKGLNLDGYEITEFTKMGIYEFDITKFNDYAKDENSGLTDAVIATENNTLTFCNFEYINGIKINEVSGEQNIFNGYQVQGLNDYLQINFNYKSKHSINPKFRISFVW